MSDRFLALLFWGCAAAIVLSQGEILASTVRAWKFGRPDGARTSFAEWSFAVVPALALAGVLWLSWMERV